MKQLTGRVAVVTGAASGIGRALALRLASEGMQVVLSDVEEAPLKDAVAEVTRTGAEAVGVRADVRYEQEVQQLADRALESFGAVHVLCNNAGVETGGRFSEIPLTSWRWVMEVNVFGLLHGCRAFLPLLRQQPEGHIVNTASGASFGTSVPTFAPYSTSKHAALALTMALDVELRAGAENIGVSLLAPGAVQTNMTESERNRPSDVPGTSGDPQRHRVMNALRQFTAEHGMAPATVADMVVEAIYQRRFFILTHPDQSLAAVRGQLDWMATGSAPPLSSLGEADA